ncbi:cytochrome P450 family oxidoreductase, putative [Rhizoctonia solani AG-3 Rhs1AP]|uniref:Cytochrome P450 family oxidoreductase, putative n=1 Tax=Rhizoctonia solani AG-3 Rhs1AP TaxID=1086054 RepID=X8JV15_9AGAM|nr:cytochrome P450 family oxidoreductase, putative [Rhizoctonia solani AG-3 Rhs1AP]
MNPYVYYPAGALFVWLLLKVYRIGRRERFLPPGPPTVPLLGNLHIFPKSEAHYRLTEWARQYGGIYSIKMGPGTAVVITDPTIVKDLMDKRSQSTIDRPASHMVDRVAGGMNMVLARYTKDWRTLRRVSHELLTQRACARHVSIQRAESSQLLHDFLTDPKKFYTHLRRNSSSVILSVLFGKRAPRFETQEVTDFFEAQHMWEHVLTPGALPPVDFLPFLKWVPRPLAKWKDYCDETRKRQRDLYFGLLRETEERVANGHENGSFMEEVLARQEEFGMSRELVGYLGGVMIEGGSDTTSSWLQSLVLALAAFPDAQRKAQDEIDKVVGADRMPTPDDFLELPYIQAVIKEVHRWRPVAPLAIPHGTIEEISYRGYRIPTGSTIFVNNWGMFHDPDVYERPEDFWPDRWLLNEFGTKPGIDNSDRRNNIWFGSGRRFCPGVHLATNSLMVNTMNLVWGFNYGPEMDEKTGKPIPVDIWNYAKGILTCPEPFMITITPRSLQHAEVLEHEFQASTAAFIPYEHGLREEDKQFIKAQRA